MRAARAASGCGADRRAAVTPVGLPLQRVKTLEVVEVVLVEKLDAQPGLGDRGYYLADRVLELHVPLVRQARRRAGVGPGPVDHLGRAVEVVVSDHGAGGTVQYLREGMPVDQVQESAGRQ